MSHVNQILNQMQGCREDSGACGPAPLTDASTADQRDRRYFADRDYREALDSFASLDGNASAIDAEDAERLSIEPNTSVLANLMERDPALRIILSSRSTLETGKNSTVSVPPQHYRRLVYLAQHALKALVDPDLKATGIYDETTRRAVSVFHGRIGVSPEEGGRGSKMGPRTLSAMIMRVRHDPRSIRMMFEDARMEFANTDGKRLDPFYIYPVNRDEKDTVARARVRLAIRDAMAWMGHMNLDVDVETSAGMIALREALHEHVGYIDVMGPVSMSKISSMLYMARPTVERLKPSE